ncbi:MAG: hypothetical protein SynsKO_00910 [Synoicihabitans sp.]
MLAVMALILIGQKSTAQTTFVIDGTVTNFNAPAEYWGGSGAPLGYWFQVKLTFDASIEPSSQLTQYISWYESIPLTIELEFENNFLSQSYTGYANAQILNDSPYYQNHVQDGIVLDWENTGLSSLYGSLSPRGRPGLQLLQYGIDSTPLFADQSLPTSIDGDLDFTSVVIHWDSNSSLTGSITGISSFSAVPEPNSAGAICGLIALTAVTGRRKRRLK